MVRCKLCRPLLRSSKPRPDWEISFATTRLVSSSISRGFPVKADFGAMNTSPGVVKPKSLFVVCWPLVVLEIVLVPPVGLSPPPPFFLFLSCSAKITISLFSPFLPPFNCPPPTPPPLSSFHTSESSEPLSFFRLFGFKRCTGSSLEGDPDPRAATNWVGCFTEGLLDFAASDENWLLVLGLKVVLDGKYSFALCVCIAFVF